MSNRNEPSFIRPKPLLSLARGVIQGAQQKRRLGRELSYYRSCTSTHGFTIEATSASAVRPSSGPNMTPASPPSPESNSKTLGPRLDQYGNSPIARRTAQHVREDPWSAAAYSTDRGCPRLILYLRTAIIVAQGSRRTRAARENDH